MRLVEEARVRPRSGGKGDALPFPREDPCSRTIAFSDHDPALGTEEIELKALEGDVR